MKYPAAVLLLTIAVAACKSHSKRTVVEHVQFVDSSIDSEGYRGPLPAKLVALELTMDRARRQSLDSVLHLSVLALTREHWEKDDFANTATIQALTILSALRSNAVNAVALVMDKH